MSVAEPLLSVRDLCVAFPARHGRAPVEAVQNVSFDIAAGRTIGLVGESGSGKTTTGRAILQLQPATSGLVRLLGRELTTMAPAELRGMRRHMQFVQQNPYSSLHPRMTVAQILAEPLTVHRTTPRARIPERIAELMTLVGMDPADVRRYPHAFSGGQRQRIVIARALAVDPRFVVCDEPVSALDVRTQAQIIDLLHDLQAKLRLSYLFIAHDLAVVRAVSHQVAVMYGGRIVELGDADRVYGRPAHPYTRNLLEAAPVIDPVRQREKLMNPAPEPQFRRRDPRTGPCVFGTDHAAESSPEWHGAGPDHAVSCQYWPAGAALPEAQS